MFDGFITFFYICSNIFLIPKGFRKKLCTKFIKKQFHITYGKTTQKYSFINNFSNDFDKVEKNIEHKVTDKIVKTAYPDN